MQLRQRKAGRGGDGALAGEALARKSGSNRKGSSSGVVTGQRLVASIVAVVLLAFTIVKFFDVSVLPTPVTVESPPGMFSEERARIHLEKLWV